MNEQDELPKSDGEKKVPNQEVEDFQLNRQKVSTLVAFRAFFKNFKNLLIEILNIKKGIDVEGATVGIKRDIDFKGHNVWILICSIFIACIGLNVNSIALIIGAMLISPLMGPILGVGLAIGTNDIKTMNRSLRNLGVAVGISIATSTLYFVITPFGEVESELIARTRPTLLDLLVAIFGGLAGILAWTRAEKNTNVIPGVAIATALMPPLCTVGFGLANLNLQFFLGALYLFLINSVFISLATLLIIRYLRFPIVEFVNPQREKKVRSYVAAFVIVISIPSAFTFYSAIREGIFNRNVKDFVIQNFNYDGADVINYQANYHDENPVIEVFLIGVPLKEQQELDLNRKLANYNLSKANLKIYQNKTDVEQQEQLETNIRKGVLEDLYNRNTQILYEKEAEIASLRSQLEREEGVGNYFGNIAKEVLAQFPEVKRLGFAKLIETAFDEKTDTVPVFFVGWSETVTTQQADNNEENLQRWLRVRIDNDRAIVRSY